MSSTFSITPTDPTVLKLAPGQDGVFSFTVNSLAAPDRELKVLLEALLLGADGKGKEVDWLVVGPSRTLTMMGGETETVTITAKPTRSTLPGAHKIQLAVADEDRPHDAYAYSQPVICEVSAPPIEHHDDGGGKLPKWLLPVLIAAGVLLVGAGIVIWRLASSRGGCEEGASRPCTLGSCQGTQKCTGGAWSACEAADPSCPSRPANDRFEFAQTLTGLTTVTGTTKGATRQLEEPDHYTGTLPDAGAWLGDHSVWYKWIAPSGTGQITIDVCTTDIDSIVAVYLGGNDIATLQRVADNNNACGTGFGSRVSFQATPNALYYIAVGDAGGAREGPFTLKILGAR